MFLLPQTLWSVIYKSTLIILKGLVFRFLILKRCKVYTHFHLLRTIILCMKNSFQVLLMINAHNMKILVVIEDSNWCFAGTKACMSPPFRLIFISVCNLFYIYANLYWGCEFLCFLFICCWWDYKWLKKSLEEYSGDYTFYSISNILPSDLCFFTIVWNIIYSDQGRMKPRVPTDIRVSLPSYQIKHVRITSLRPTIATDSLELAFTEALGILRFDTGSNATLKRFPGVCIIIFYSVILQLEMLLKIIPEAAK